MIKFEISLYTLFKGLVDSIVMAGHELIGSVHAYSCKKKNMYTPTSAMPLSEATNDILCIEIIMQRRVLFTVLLYQKCCICDERNRVHMCKLDQTQITNSFKLQNFTNSFKVMKLQFH